jgi:hypothetical protein
MQRRTPTPFGGRPPRTSEPLLQNLSRSAYGGGSRIQEEQGLKVQGSLPRRRHADSAAPTAVAPVVDAEPDAIEDPDAHTAAERVDVAGANVDLLEQPLSRAQEVQDHRVHHLPRRGNLGDAVVDERLQLAPDLTERTVDGVLANEPPASRFRPLGELLFVEPVLRVEQPLASPLAHVEEREPHVCHEDVCVGAGLERLLVERDLLEGEQVSEADGTEVLDDLGDAEEVLAHDLANRSLARSLTVVDAKLHEHLLETTLELVSSLDEALGISLGEVCVAESICHDALELLLLRGRDLCSHRLSPCFDPSSDGHG